VTAALAYIPSPHSGVLHLGPVPLRMYGLMLLVGIAACVWLTRRRWEARGGDRELVYEVALYGVLAGILGARLYHDVTSWNVDPTVHDHWWGPFAVWRGGLGVWGGILFGVAAGSLVVRRSGASVAGMMDAVAPGLLLAQGIGRWGNYFNQELFGKATSLPWGLKIDYAHCPSAYQDLDASSCGRAFHPTFLYEFIWDLSGVGLLLLLHRRFRFRAPSLFALYVAFYTFGRFFEELLRIDPSHHFLGLRLNAWVSLVVFAVSSAFFVWWQLLRPRRHPDVPKATPTPAMAVPRGKR
jgi:prolipoprotein diacylglyceryl transferase